MKHARKRQKKMFRKNQYYSLKLHTSPTLGRAGWAGLATLGLVHEHEFVMTLRAKSAGFSNLRYTRIIESTSAGCSARLACDIDAEEERATQQAGIPGEVENLD